MTSKKQVTDKTNKKNLAVKQWDIVVVPFPFVDSGLAKPRPVLIISGDKINKSTSHYLAVMITTAAVTKWVGDTKISNLGQAGLKVESYIRLKFFTLDMNFEPRKIGSLSKKDIQSFSKNFSQYIF